jgi:hypothetical protein
MKILTYKYKILAVILIIAAFAVLLRMYTAERNDRIAYENNTTSLLVKVDTFKTESGLNAIKIKSLELTKKEFKKYRGEKEKIIDELNIKVRRLKSTTTIVTETKIEIKTVVRDSLVYVPGKDSLIEMKCIEYKNPYVEFNGCSDNGEFNGLIIIPDTLDHFAYRVPKMFLGIIPHGVKSIDLVVLSKNPYTKIKYAENIKLRKRGK